jgi:CheY-like chemotaxis protein
VRTLTEAGREGSVGVGNVVLQDQRVEESARLLAALESLSRARAQRDHPEGLGPGPASPSSGRPRVLVVEDDDETRKAIALGLAASYDVTTAGDGAEGLRAALGRPFDAIVTDVRMPTMDGITMAEKVVAGYGAFVPVVFLTAETDPVRVAAGFSAGGASFLIKPLDLELLDAELRWLLGRTTGR